MVEPGFLHAAFLTLRRLTVLFACGALLLFAKTRWESDVDGSARPVVEVRVPADARAPEIERVRERALLSTYAIEHGALEADPIVQRRLREDLGLQAESPAVLANAARSLSLERVDPMLRERLAWHGEQLLRARVVVPEPSEAELQRYLDAHAMRYHSPARFSLTHVLVAGRRGAGQAERISHVRAAIGRGLAPADARAWTDASLLPHELNDVSAEELDATFGPGFGEAVSALEAGAFSSPIRSRYGAHFVFVHARVALRQATLAEVRGRVKADYLVDARRTATLSAVRALGETYRVRLLREDA